MTARIRLYHGVRSPYSRLGLHIVKRAGLEAELVPFTGPPAGTAFADPTQNKPKLAYYSIDAPRMTARLGLPMKMPTPFDVDFAAANRAMVRAGLDGVGLDFAIALSDARWGEGANIAEPDVIAGTARAIGWSPEAATGALTDLAVTEALQRHRAMIEEDQVFGVPFAVMDGEKFWGHDRFELLVEKAG